MDRTIGLLEIVGAHIGVLMDTSDWLEDKIISI